MILDNPYHRRKVKKILQENTRMLAELSELQATLDGYEKVVKDLKNKISGYKAHITKLQKLKE